MLKKSISTFLVFALMIPYLTPAFDVAKAEPAGTEASSGGGGFSSPLLGGVDERGKYKYYYSLRRHYYNSKNGPNNDSGDIYGPANSSTAVNTIDGTFASADEKRVGGGYEAIYGALFPKMKDNIASNIKKEDVEFFTVVADPRGEAKSQLSFDDIDVLLRNRDDGTGSPTKEIQVKGYGGLKPGELAGTYDEIEYKSNKGTERKNGIKLSDQSVEWINISDVSVADIGSGKSVHYKMSWPDKAINPEGRNHMEYRPNAQEFYDKFLKPMSESQYFKDKLLYGKEENFKHLKNIVDQTVKFQNNYADVENRFKEIDDINQTINDQIGSMNLPPELANKRKKLVEMEKSLNNVIYSEIEDPNIKRRAQGDLVDAYAKVDEQLNGIINSNDFKKMAAIHRNSTGYSNAGKEQQEYINALNEYNQFKEEYRNAVRKANNAPYDTPEFEQAVKDLVVQTEKYKAKASRLYMAARMISTYGGLDWGKPYPPNSPEGKAIANLNKSFDEISKKNSATSYSGGSLDKLDQEYSTLKGKSAYIDKKWLDEFNKINGTSVKTEYEARQKYNELKREFDEGIKKDPKLAEAYNIIARTKNQAEAEKNNKLADYNEQKGKLNAQTELSADAILKSLPTKEQIMKLRFVGPNEIGEDVWKKIESTRMKYSTFNENDFYKMFITSYIEEYLNFRQAEEPLRSKIIQQLKASGIPYGDGDIYRVMVFYVIRIKVYEPLDLYAKKPKPVKKEQPPNPGGGDTPQVCYEITNEYGGEGLTKVLNTYKSVRAIDLANKKKHYDKVKFSATYTPDGKTDPYTYEVCFPLKDKPQTITLVNCVNTDINQYKNPPNGKQPDNEATYKNNCESTVLLIPPKGLDLIARAAITKDDDGTSKTVPIHPSGIGTMEIPPEIREYYPRGVDTYDRIEFGEIMSGECTLDNPNKNKIDEATGNFNINWNGSRNVKLKTYDAARPEKGKKRVFYTEYHINEKHDKPTDEINYRNNHDIVCVEIEGDDTPPPPQLNGNCDEFNIDGTFENGGSKNLATEQYTYPVNGDNWDSDSIEIKDGELLGATYRTLNDRVTHSCGSRPADPYWYTRADYRYENDDEVYSGSIGIPENINSDMGSFSKRIIMNETTQPNQAPMVDSRYRHTRYVYRTNSQGHRRCSYGITTWNASVISSINVKYYPGVVISKDTKLYDPERNFGGGMYNSGREAKKDTSMFSIKSGYGYALGTQTGGDTEGSFVNETNTKFTQDGMNQATNYSKTAYISKNSDKFWLFRPMSKVPIIENADSPLNPSNSAQRIDLERARDFEQSSQRTFAFHRVPQGRWGTVGGGKNHAINPAVNTSQMFSHIDFGTKSGKKPLFLELWGSGTFVVSNPFDVSDVRTYTRADCVRRKIDIEKDTMYSDSYVHPSDPNRGLEGGTHNQDPTTDLGTQKDRFHHKK